jgi:hypothetical protein
LGLGFALRLASISGAPIVTTATIGALALTLDDDF